MAAPVNPDVMCNLALLRHLFFASLSASIFVGVLFAASAYWVYGIVAIFMGFYALAVAAIPSAILSLPMYKLYESLSRKASFPAFLATGALVAVIFQAVIGHGLTLNLEIVNVRLVRAYAIFGVAAASGAWLYLSLFGPSGRFTHNNGFNTDAGKARAG